MQIVLLYSGSPLPAMLELGFVSASRGDDVRMILVDRHVNDLSLDKALVNYPVTTISSPYNGLDARRLLSFPLTVWRIGVYLFRFARPGCVLITSTLDMLIIAKIFGWFRITRIRHQVRDLHALQLGDGVLSQLLRAIERWLLKNCELLMYSAPAFYEKHYRALYSGPAVLLENLPRPAVWRSFKRQPRSRRGLKIGYVGIIRYLNPLLNLVDAIEVLARRGVDCSLLIAGGGDSLSLQQRVTMPERFIFKGKFEYTSAVAGLHSDVDLIFAVYDRFDPNCQLAMPTKYYESLVTRIPILVSEGTYIGDLVERTGVGRAVDGESVASLVGALEEVAQPDSWYANAQAKLAAMDISAMYALYDLALARAVAPDVGSR